MRVGIFGAGRIGRALARNIAGRDELELGLIADRELDRDDLQFLLRYDSTYGVLDPDRFERLSKVNSYVGDRPEVVPWSDHGVTAVIDASGDVTLSGATYRALLDAGVDRVIATRMAPDQQDHTIVHGVNGHLITAGPTVVYGSTCDAVAVGTVLHALAEHLTIVGGDITTLHPWLSNQQLLDGAARGARAPGEGLEVLRAAPGNLIPRGTSLVRALAALDPEAAGRFTALSFRTPTEVVACAILSLQIADRIDDADLASVLARCVEQRPGCLGRADQALVSKDFNGRPEAAIIDGAWSAVTSPGHCRLVLWYDNESGYAAQIVELLVAMIDKRVQP